MTENSHFPSLVSLLCFYFEQSLLCSWNACFILVKVRRKFISWALVIFTSSILPPKREAELLCEHVIEKMRKVIVLRNREDKIIKMQAVFFFILLADPLSMRVRCFMLPCSCTKTVGVVCDVHPFNWQHTVHRPEAITRFLWYYPNPTSLTAAFPPPPGQSNL